MTKRNFAALFIFGALLASCGQSANVPQSPTELPELQATHLEDAVQITPDQNPDLEGTIDINRRVDEDPNFRFNPMLAFDAIPPIYNPVHAVAGKSGLEGQELVLGIEIAGEARAYPISVLRSREMVNDELAGIPILVTW